MHSHVLGLQPKVFGNQSSVLVGDFLFSRAFQLMVGDGSLEILRILSTASAVIAEGEVAAGMAVTHQRYAGERIGIVEMYRDWFARKKLGAAQLRRTLAAPIGARARADCEALLAALDAAE